MTTKTFTIVLMLMLLCILLFWFYPQLDISSSQPFFDASRGFIWRHAEWAKHLRTAITTIITLLTVFIAGNLIIKLLRPKMKVYLQKKTCVYLLLCLAFGPGLVTNSLLKNHWGRPRPYMTQPFGGDLSFKAAWIPSHACPTNCSFVCGDASQGFIFLALIPFVRRKKTIASLAIISGGLIGLLRMAQGGHFLSDVIFSGFVNYLVFWSIYHIMYSRSSLADSLKKTNSSGH